MTDLLRRQDLPRERSAARTTGIEVVGSGLIATAIREAFARHPVGGDEAAVVYAADTWSDQPSRLAGDALAAGRCTFCVSTEPGRVLIGPYARPGRPGCSCCVEHRRDLADVETPARAALRAADPQTTLRPAGLLTGPALLAVAALTLTEISRSQTGAAPRLVIVELSDLTVTAHSFLPDPLCSTCGRLPDDRPDDVLTDAGRPQPKTDPDNYRIGDLDPDRLSEIYVDPMTGVIREVKRGVQGGLIVAGAILPLRNSRDTEPGVGRSDRYAASRRIAILEALERYGGVEPGGRRTTVTARLADLDHGLDVRRLGTHDAADYARPGFGFRPFDEYQRCRWVYGWSYRHNEAILVPQTLAYYRHHFDGDPIDRPFVYDNSNGCALGSSLEEAVLHGLLEILERDAFLLTWYCRIPAPQIDLDHADDEIRTQAAAVAASTGYQLRAFDITTEHGIPCVWALATARASHSPTGRPLPALVCAAGAHPDARQAVRNALNEVGPLLEDLVSRFPSEADRAERMVDHPEEVRGMLDHSTMYGTHRAAARLDFLRGRQHLGSFQPIATRSIDRIGSGGFGHHDLRDDLREAVDRVVGSGSDVIVVDQTTPEHRAAGLSCVKVLVPGALSMTFGHRFRRTSGIDRLLTAPQLLGYQNRPLRTDELNLAPHPFP